VATPLTGVGLITVTEPTLGGSCGPQAGQELVRRRVVRVSFDAERHNQNLARWAIEDLTWFGLKGWQRIAGGSGSGTG
jgi:hypothetical protein